MLETEKTENPYQNQPTEKKINVVPILIGLFAILIVAASLVTVYMVLFSTSKPETEKSVITTTDQAPPAAAIKDEQDLQKVGTDVDSVNPDALSTDLDQNDKDALSF